MAALLAEQKFVATREFLTHRDGGLYGTYSGGGRLEAVTDDLGTRWELQQIALRLWPSASSIQGMNTALFDLVEQNRIDPARVNKVRIGVSPWVFDLHGKLPAYAGKFEAMLSAHYTAAVIVHDQALTLTQFDASRYDDAVLRRAAAEQVEMRPDPALDGVEATAEIEMVDGTKLAAHCVHPRGAPENPLSRAQIEHKLRTYAPARLDDAATEQVIAAVDRLEDLGSVRDLMGLLRAPERQAPRRMGEPQRRRGQIA
jgi:2-methylcitrate dehydratase PrpD